MIYVGLINFNDNSNTERELVSIIKSYTDNNFSFIQKNNFLSLCYGKLSTSHDMDYVWENSTSFLLGRFFDKEEHQPFTQNDFQNVHNLCKETVLQKIWGKYIYLHIDKEEAKIEVVIDSTGQLPFFYYTLPNGNVLFASDIELIFKALTKRLEYNWTYLHSYLVYGGSSSIQTPFKHIYELPPACYLTINKYSSITKTFWNPLQSSIQGQDAGTVLQSTLKQFTKPYKNICVTLSGGLDSSSIVYCLKDIKKTDQTLFAINYFHPSIKASNELNYARKICEEVAIELIEIDASSALPFDYSNKKQPLNPNKPSHELVNSKWHELISAYIPSNESSIIIGGQGSDHIFMCPPTKKSLTDYILEKGLKGAGAKLQNITHLYRDSLFSVLAENAISLGSYVFAYRRKKRHPKNILDRAPPWIKEIIDIKITSDFHHPIYERLPSRILPGKYAQIDALYEGLASIQVEMNPINPTFNPFLCHPMIEFALSIPTYELFDKGYDRYPLRKSISERFHTETVWRRDKGETTGVFQLGVKKNLDYVLDLCLDGVLIKQNIIDKKELRKTILLISNGDINYLWPFTYLSAIEIFIKQWNEKNF